MGSEISQRLQTATANRIRSISLLSDSLEANLTRLLFVIMPFTEKGAIGRPKGFFDEVLKSLIIPAGNAAKFAVETAGRKGSDVIHHTIVNQLIQAELVIADLTDHNPSVLFELGIRIAVPEQAGLPDQSGRDRPNFRRGQPYASSSV